ncbi:MAG TPA: RsfS/YbeB/iojap family protein, partial [Anaeromyxobacteraceae bacterium]|nr:RsfS/YbeB/iojap family protein [Anaeromyxobacteraceae bacterium]
GYESGRWILVDYGDVVAHVFNRETRGFYDLEGLWADAPRFTVHG